MIELLAAASLFQQKAYPLKLNLKLGDAFEVSMVREFSDAEDEFDLAIEEKLNFKVVENQAGRITLGIVRSVVSQKMDGVALPLDPNAQPAILRDIRQANGALVWTKPVQVDADSEARLWRLNTIGFPDAPVKVGQVWSLDWGEIEGLKLPSAKSKFRFVEVNAENTRALVWVDFEEFSTKDPIKASGRAVVDMLTGWPVEQFMTVQNARIPGGDGKPVKLAMTLRRKA